MTRIVAELETLFQESIASPIGAITLITAPDAPARALLLGFDFEGDWNHGWLERRHPGARLESTRRRTQAGAHLAAYLEGEVDALDRIECDAPGTPFQRQVWKELRRIPAGQVISYGELARRVGEPTACRAVASANARNPIAIVVPCHRVIAANGTLHGYAGGLDRKRWLLEHEARHARSNGASARSAAGQRLLSQGELWARTTTTSSPAGSSRARAKRSTT
ncbi:MAG: methylated-DNA--[protein]-cysteine S-methyltransferase [Candidatus Eisenbacteria bacterium]